jgi:hypothetical protein
MGKEGSAKYKYARLSLADRWQPSGRRRRTCRRAGKATTPTTNKHPPRRRTLFERTGENSFFFFFFWADGNAMKGKRLVSQRSAVCIAASDDPSLRKGIRVVEPKAARAVSCGEFATRCNDEGTDGATNGGGRKMSSDRWRRGPKAREKKPPSPSPPNARMETALAETDEMSSVSVRLADWPCAPRDAIRRSPRSGQQPYELSGNPHREGWTSGSLSLIHHHQWRRPRRDEERANSMTHRRHRGTDGVLLQKRRERRGAPLVRVSSSVNHIRLAGCLIPHPDEKDTCSGP